MKANPILKIILNEGYFQFILTIFLIAFTLFYRVLGLPDPSELLGYFKIAYINYGIGFIIIASFFEALFMLSFYLPGSLVILLAILNSSMQPNELLFIGFLALVGFTLANICNYILGRKGFYLFFLKLGKKDIIERMGRQLSKSKFWTLFLTGFHPNFLSIAVVSLGITGEGFIKTIFLAFLVQTIWIFIWFSLLSPFISQVDLSNHIQMLYFIIIVFLWGVVNGLIGVIRYKNSQSELK